MSPPPPAARPSLTRARAWTTLARWLGPWSDVTASPQGRPPETLILDPHRDLHAQLYWPERLGGALLLVHGMHHLGNTDHRFVRLCRILAAAGIAVLAPSLPDYRSLRMAPSVVRDVQVAFDALCERLPPGSRPGIMSISFGSLPALRLVSDPAYADRAGGIVVFGGYGDFVSAIHFILDGTTPGLPPGTQDRLTRPVAFMNVAPGLAEPLAGLDTLVAAWHRYCLSTWGNPDLWEPADHQPVARRQALDLPEALRPTFLTGCGERWGMEDELLDSLRATPDPWWDPRPHLHGLRCPVTLVHGVDDKVIPHPQLDELAAAVPAGCLRGVHRTGLYSHTATAGLSLSMLREGRTLVQVLGGLVSTATHGLA